MRRLSPETLAAEAADWMAEVDVRHVELYGWAASYGWYVCTSQYCGQHGKPVRVVFERTEHFAFVAHPVLACMECSCQPERLRHDDPRLEGMEIDG